jgi:Reverse transcriptase (RNA-dependent DNA polymerase)
VTSSDHPPSPAIIPKLEEVDYIPATFVRILLKLYTEHCVQVTWADFASDYFSVVNGVKQGGVLTPTLFCVYIEDLLVKLSQCGVGRFIGTNFVGAFAYADDIVLLAPSPSATLKLLPVCESFALHYNIVFNASKSNFLVINPSSRRGISRQMNDCSFSIGDMAGE